MPRNVPCRRAKIETAAVSILREDARSADGDNRDKTRRRDNGAAFIRAAIGAQRFALRMQVATDRLDQFGPARIVTSSAGASSRNFTVGQEASDLVFRFRTRLTRLNGSRPEVRIAGAFLGNVGRTVTISVSYDRGPVVLAADGHVSRTSSYAFGPWSVWLLIPLRVVPSMWFHLLNVTVVLVVMISVGGLFRAAVWQRSSIPAVVFGTGLLGLLLFVIPRLFGLAAASPVLWVIGAAGYLSGYRFRDLVTARQSPAR